MISLTHKKFYATIQIVENYTAIVAAEDLDNAWEETDNLFSACNIDGFELQTHTFEIRDVEELDPDDPSPVANDWVLSRPPS